MKNKKLTQEEINQNLFQRLEKLESIVKSGKSVETSKVKEFSGPKGGILFLISKNFFSQKRTAQEVKGEMNKFKYFYIIQVIQTTLNRLSDKTGPLVSVEENGKKVYVKRK